MKKISKIVSAFVCLAMAVGVGVAIGSTGRDAEGVKAAGTDTTQYALISSTSDLETGKSYILTNGTSGTVKAASNATNTNNRKATDVSVTEGKITRGSSILSFTLGGSSGSWTFYTENYSTNGYLGSSTSSSGNYLKVDSTARAATIAFNGEAATINIAPHNTRNLICFNSTIDSNNGGFACYSSQGSYGLVYLWKEVAASTDYSITCNITGGALSTKNESDTFNSTHKVGTIYITPDSDHELPADCTSGFSVTAGATFSYSWDNTDGDLAIYVTNATGNITVSGAFPAKPSIVFDDSDVSLDITSTTGVTKSVTATNVTNVEYMWYTSDENITLENDDTATVTIKPNTSETGNATVQLLVTGDNISDFEDSFTVNLVEADPGTEANPYTVEEAREAIATSTGITGVYGTGIVSKIVTEYSTQYSNITFDITDDGADSESVFLRVFRCGGSSAANVQVGDTVVVSGNLKEYNSIKEFDQGCNLETLTKRSLSSIALSGNYPTEFAVDDAFSHEGMTVTGSFSGNSATVDFSSVATFSGYNMSTSGNQTVTVSVTDNGNTKTTTYTINVIAGITKYTVSFNGNGASGSMSSVQVNEGTDYTLPVNGFEVPSLKTFAGWKANGTGNTLAAGASYTVNADVEFVAQWDDVPTSTYKKVKANLYNFSGDYLIVYEAGESGNVAFDGSLTGLDAASNNVGVTISSEKIALQESYEFHIASITGGYSIQASSNKYIGQNSDANGMLVGDSAYTNTISYVNDSTDDMKIAGSGNAVLRYNSASNNERFRFFKTATYTGQKAVALYMQVDKAEEFALELLNLTYGTCSTWTEGHDKQSSDFTEAWTTLSNLYDTFKTDTAMVNKLAGTTADEHGTMIQEAMARYDLLVNKYHLTNIITSRVTSGAYHAFNIFGSDSSTAISLIVIISVVSITAVGAFYFVRRRKEN